MEVVVDPVLIGEIAALGSALTWGITSLLLRSETPRADAVTLNALRTLAASAGLVVAAVALGEAGALLEVPSWALALLLISVVVGVGVGDTLYVEGLHLLGVARAMPISLSYPIFTTALAVLLLGEEITPANALGIALVVAGVWLVAVPPGRPTEVPVGERRGLVVAVGSALCWTISTLTLRPALEVVSPLAAGALRLPMATAVLWFFVLNRPGPKGPIPRRTALVMGATGLITATSALLFLVALDLAGAARAATLSSTSPLFAAPAAVVFLGERLTPRIVVGTVLAVVGIALLA
ncbi:MAG TPA: GRP family sugar transporter [Chloroflexota bacterium]